MGKLTVNVQDHQYNVHIGQDTYESICNRIC